MRGVNTPTGVKACLVGSWSARCVHREFDAWLMLVQALEFFDGKSRPFGLTSTNSWATSFGLWSSVWRRGFGVFAAACPTAIQGAPPAGFYRCVLACHASLALPKHLMVERTHSVSLHTHAQDDVHAARRYPFASLIVQWVVLIGWTSGRSLGLPFAHVGSANCGLIWLAETS